MNPSVIAIFRVKFKKINKKVRNFYLKVLGLKIKDNCHIGNIICEWPSKILIEEQCTIQDNTFFWFKKPFDSDSFISIGKKTFIGRNCEFNCNSKIVIGSNVLIASNTIVVDNNHQIFKNTLINIQPISVSEVTIEDDVWIGTGAIILMGVNIGYGAVVAAGAVVTKSIPTNEIWGGVPAKKIGERLIVS